MEDAAAAREPLESTQNGKREALEDLVRRHMPLIRALSRRFPVTVDREDLVQAGCVGLLRALGGFDPGRGVRFSTYCVPFVLGEMRDALRKESPVKLTRLDRRLLAGARREQERLTGRLGREPTMAEIAARLDLAPADLAALFAAANPTADVDGSPLPGNAALLGLQDAEGAIDALALRQALSRLPAGERAAVVLSFWGGLTQVEIGRRLNISQPQVSRLIRRGLRHLRSRLQG